MFYRVPITLKEEELKVIAEIEEIKAKFNKRIEAENLRIKEEYQAKLKAREFTYSINTTFMPNWKILMKSAINPVDGATDNMQWSTPFKVINSVLFYCEYLYQGRCWNIANTIIPQGLFALTDEELLAIKW